MRMRGDFLGMTSSIMPSIPSLYCSKILARIARWTEDFTWVCPVTSSLMLNLFQCSCSCSRLKKCRVKCKWFCAEREGVIFQLNVVCPAPKCRSRFRTVPNAHVLCCCMSCLCWVALSSNLVPWLQFEVKSVLRALPLQE